MRKLALWIATLLLVTTGCVISPRRTVGSSTGGGGGSNSEFSLSANPTSQAVSAGASATYAITVQAVNGFTGTVSLSASAANASVIASLDNNTIIGGSGSANLTIQTTSTTPSGAVSITITAADSANNVSQNVTVTATVQGTAATAGAVVPVTNASGPVGCVTGQAGSGIQRVSMPSTPGSSGFTAAFDGTPSTTEMDAVFGLLSAVPGANATLNGLIHFNPDGVIEVRDGDTFVASNTHFVADNTYHFRLAGNLPAATYSVFVTPPSGTEMPLGTNLQVPAGLRGITVLNGWGMLTNSPQGAVLNTCQFSLQ
jgi:hypothetical protein